MKKNEEISMSMYGMDFDFSVDFEYIPEIPETETTPEEPKRIVVGKLWYNNLLISPSRYVNIYNAVEDALYELYDEQDFIEDMVIFWEELADE